jgi:hypothetical protein
MVLKPLGKYQGSITQPFSAYFVCNKQKEEKNTGKEKAGHY